LVKTERESAIRSGFANDDVAPAKPRIAQSSQTETDRDRERENDVPIVIVVAILSGLEMHLSRY